MSSQSKECLLIQQLRILQMEWVSRFEKVHPHPSTKMDGQADRRMYDRKNARLDAHIPTQIEAGGSGPASQNIPRTQP